MNSLRMDPTAETSPPAGTERQGKQLPPPLQKARHEKDTNRQRLTETPASTSASSPRRANATAGSRLVAVQSYAHALYATAPLGLTAYQWHRGARTPLDNVMSLTANGLRVLGNPLTAATAAAATSATVQVVVVPSLRRFPNQDVCRAAELALDGEGAGAGPYRQIRVNEKSRRSDDTSGSSEQHRETLSVFERGGGLDGDGSAALGASLFGSPSRSSPQREDRASTGPPSTVSFASTRMGPSATGSHVGTNRSNPPSSSVSSADSGAVTIDFGADTEWSCSDAVSGSSATRTFRRSLLGCFSVAFAAMLCRDADCLLEVDAAAPQTASLHPTAPGSIPTASGPCAGEGGRNSSRPSSPAVADATASGGGRERPIATAAPQGSGDLQDGQRLVSLLTSLFYALQDLELNLERQRKLQLLRLQQQIQTAQARREAAEAYGQDLDTVLGAKRRRAKSDPSGSGENGRAEAGEGTGSAEVGNAMASSVHSNDAPNARALDALRAAVMTRDVYASARNADDAGQQQQQQRRLTASTRRQGASKQVEAEGDDGSGGEVQTPRGVVESRKRVQTLWRRLLSLSPLTVLRNGYLEWWLRHGMNNWTDSRSIHQETNTPLRAALQHAPDAATKAKGNSEGEKEQEEARQNAEAVITAYGLRLQQDCCRELYCAVLALIREVGSAPPGTLLRDALAWASSSFDAQSAATSLLDRRSGAGGGDGGGPRDNGNCFVFTPCVSLANTPQHLGGKDSLTAAAAAAMKTGGRGDGGDPPSPGKARRDLAGARQGQLSCASLPIASPCFLANRTASAKSLHVPPTLRRVLACLHTLVSLYSCPPAPLADLVADRGAYNYELLQCLCQLMCQVPIDELLKAAAEAESSHTVVSPRSQALLLFAGQSLSLAAGTAAHLSGMRTALRSPLSILLSRLTQLRAALTGASSQATDNSGGLANTTAANFPAAPTVSDDAPAKEGGPTSTSTVCSPASALAKQRRALSYIASGYGFGKTTQDFDRECDCVASLLACASWHTRDGSTSSFSFASPPFTWRPQ